MDFSKHDLYVEQLETPVVIPSYVDTLFHINPSVQIFCDGDPYEYPTIKFNSSDDRNFYTQSVLDSERLNIAKIRTIQKLFHQCNRLQLMAMSYHTVTQTSATLQKEIYQLKYQYAVNYVNDCNEADEANEPRSSVPVPVMLSEEAAPLGVDPYVLSLLVIQNFIASQDSMAAYFGRLEAERRTKKRLVLETTTLDQLKNLQFSNWSTYVPTVPMDIAE